MEFAGPLLRGVFVQELIVASFVCIAQKDVNRVNNWIKNKKTKTPWSKRDAFLLYRPVSTLFLPSRRFNKYPFDRTLFTVNLIIHVFSYRFFRRYNALMSTYLNYVYRMFFFIFQTHVWILYFSDIYLSGKLSVRNPCLIKNSKLRKVPIHKFL